MIQKIDPDNIVRKRTGIAGISKKTPALLTESDNFVTVGSPQESNADRCTVHSHFLALITSIFFAVKATLNRSFI